MNLEQVKEEKKKLEETIKKEVNAFREKVGRCNVCIFLEPINSVGEEYVTAYDVNIELEI